MAERNAFFDGKLFVCFGEPDTDKEDITRSEGDSLLCGDLFDKVQRDDCALESGEGELVLFGVGGDINQDAAANDAAIVDPCLFESDNILEVYHGSLTVNSKDVSRLNGLLRGSIIKELVRLICYTHFSQSNQFLKARCMKTYHNA